MNKIIRILQSLIESSIRNISGGVGQRIRYLYYRNRFKQCGKNVKIDIGVLIENPENITLGNNVWILPYSIITARPKNLMISNRIEKKIKNYNFHYSIGEIIIGNEVAIGAFNILQGYGGLVIEDRVTTSAKVSIYSHSHYPYDESDPAKITFANSMIQSDHISCIESPIIIETGVWLGLGVSIFGGTIGKYSFVSANSIVISNLETNSYAAGNPAKKIKNRFQLDD